MSLYKSKVIIESHTEEADFCGKIDESRINRAEELLSIKFPPSYREFLSLFGCGDLFSVEIFGIINDPDSDSKALPNGVWLTLSEHGVGMNKKLIIISETGDGAYYVLDSSAPDKLGEYPVLLLDDSGDLEFVASNFDDFLSDRLEAMKGD